MKFELTGMLRAEMVFKEPVGDVPGISGGRDESTNALPD